MSGTLKPLFTWRSAIAESTLPSTTRHVAVALSLYMSERGDSAHPGPARLAQDTGLHLSTVKEKLADLERLGWVRCISRGGRRGEQRRANEYVATFPEPPLFDPQPVAHGDPSPSTTGRRECGDPSPSPRQPVAHGDPISSMNSPETSPTRAIDTDFDAWWADYPRHRDRGAALKAYRARRREGITAERLTAARDHYARAVAGSEYIKHGATFLAKDGPWSEWEHGPPDTPARRTAPDPAPAQPTRTLDGRVERFMPGAGWITETVGATP